MLIKYKSTSCGPDGSFQPGDTREVPDNIGVELVVGGYAENVTPRSAVREQAVAAPAVEQAVAPAQPTIPQPQPSRTPKRGR